MKHPGHTYGGFVSTISKRGMTKYLHFMTANTLHTLRVLLVPEQKKSIKSKGRKQELQCHNCSRIKNTTYNPYDVERLEQLCHFTSRSVLVITWFTLPSISQALSPNHSSSQSLFSSRLIFLWWLTLKRYLCYILYIVKVKENPKELVWQMIMVDGEWCASCGVRKGKVKEVKIVQVQMICGYG
jgi:hypothetical protein